MNESTAKIIRVLTTPPIMALLLILLLRNAEAGFFRSTLDITVILCGLVVLPILAYPCQKLLPPFREQGREGQRMLAFVFSLVGYALAFLYGIIARTSIGFRVIVWTYLLSVVLLTVLNKVTPLHASGHAASSFAPVVMCGYYIGPMDAVVLLVIFLLSMAASLSLQRHKLSEFLLGSLATLVSFGIALLIV